jgi:hypothetical protein
MAPPGSRSGLSGFDEAGVPPEALLLAKISHVLSIKLRATDVRAIFDGFSID